MYTVSTDDLSASERFGFWREISSRTWVPYDVRCEPHLEELFQARMNICELGSVQVAQMKSTPYAIHRTAKLIRQDDPEVLKLSVAVHGEGVITQDDRHARFAVGDLVLYDTSRPYSARLTTDTPTSQLLVLRFERSLLRLPDRDLRRLTAKRIPGAAGVGALSSQFLLQLARHIGEYTLADVARLSTLALDVLAVAFAHVLDAGNAVPAETRHRALLARIHAFIQANLGDPELSPGSIATAHQISVRYLHKLFHQQGHTVAGWIRELRLERCRRDLADPRFAADTVSAVAARWGFTNPAHFSQVFRSAHDLPPGQFRARHTAPAHDAVHEN